MALLQYQAPVDYAAQLDGFKDFLQHFKTLQSSSEAAATEAMEDLNIDGNRTSDEYDFMDDVDDGEGAQTRGARRRREPKLKYMQILQDVSNRDSANIVIELDDLDVVSLPLSSIFVNCHRKLIVSCIVRKIPAGGTAVTEPCWFDPEKH